MTGGGAAIDNGSSQPSAGLSSAYSSALGLREPQLGPETRTRPDRGCGGVGGSLPAITNGYEEPPYLLTLKRI